MIPLMKSSTLSRICSPSYLACLILKSATIFSHLITLILGAVPSSQGIFQEAKLDCGGGLPQRAVLVHRPLKISDVRL